MPLKCIVASHLYSSSSCDEMIAATVSHISVSVFDEKSQIVKFISLLNKKKKYSYTAITIRWVSKLKPGNKVAMDIFSLCDACACSVGVTYIHSPLSGVTHHRIIYNSAQRPSRPRGGTQMAFIQTTLEGCNNYQPALSMYAFAET